MALSHFSFSDHRGPSIVQFGGTPRERRVGYATRESFPLGGYVYEVFTNKGERVYRGSSMREGMAALEAVIGEGVQSASCAMELLHKSKSYTVADFAEASRLYASLRAASGLGASQFPDGEIWQDGKPVARVSYNAKVWPLAEWHAEMAPLFDPYKS